jgi:plasmid replication initiation protein
LKKAIENLFERTLSLIPESEQNEQIERLDALEKLIDKSAPVGRGELLGVAAKMVLDAT